jgi:hypothetical protein
MHWIAELQGIATGAEVFVLGTGPSLTGFDWSRLDGRVTIAINAAVHFRTPTVHIVNDTVGELWKYLKFPYQPETRLVVQHNGAATSGLNFLLANHFPFMEQVYCYRLRGPDSETNELFVDHTTSTAAIQLALVMGAHAVYLMGCDGYRKGFAEYAAQVRETDTEETVMLARTQDDRDHRRLREWMEKTERLPPGGIVNLSERSVIEIWPRRPLAEMFR